MHAVTEQGPLVAPGVTPKGLSSFSLTFIVEGYKVPYCH